MLAPACGAWAPERAPCQQPWPSQPNMLLVRGPQHQASLQPECLESSQGHARTPSPPSHLSAGEPPPPAKQGRRWAGILLGVGLVAAAGLLAAYAQQRQSEPCSWGGHAEHATAAYTVGGCRRQKVPSLWSAVKQCTVPDVIAVLQGGRMRMTTLRSTSMPLPEGHCPRASCAC